MGRRRPAEGRHLLIRPTTERLIALLHAQRGEAAQRAREVRGSPRWLASSNRLDELNDRIMHDPTVDPSNDTAVPGAERPGAERPGPARHPD